MNALNVWEREEAKPLAVPFLAGKWSVLFNLLSCILKFVSPDEFPPKWLASSDILRGQAYNPAVFIKVSIYELEMGTENIPLKSSHFPVCDNFWP